MSFQRRNRQFAFEGMGFGRTTGVHGGEVGLGKRKTRRPFDPKQALHVVLRSSKAKGRHSLLHPAHCNNVRDLLERLKVRWDVTVYRYANVGNHLHLLLRAKSRKDWQGFIREFSGGVVMLVTGARKGKGLSRARSRSAPRSSERGFWDHLVYSRIVRFGRAFRLASDYVLTNLWEAAGVPVRKYLARGYRVLEVSDSGGIWLREGLP